MLATHPDRHAMTGVQTPHRSASPSKRARLAFVAHHRSPVAAIDMRNPDQPARLAVRRLAYPGYGYARLAALHVGFLARARARRCPPPGPKPRDRNHPSETSSEASRGSLGSPSGIVRLSSHGSSLPGGAGLASLPGAVANRIGDATVSLAIQGTPHEAPLVSETNTIRN